jgi:hypothetical protein
MAVTINGEPAGKGRSTIAFPYSDIGDAIRVAEGLLKGGGVAMTRDQLAAAMNAAPGSGSFNMKVNTARTFGVMDNSSGKYQLTELGFEIADPGRQREAMVRAFLNVDLYRKTFEEFRGKRLPPRPHGIENAFVTFGVAPKQAANARLAFEKSARAAGFFPNAEEDRLVEPLAMPHPTAEAVETAAATVAGGGARFGGGGVASFAPQAAVQPLEYQLVDLLKTEGVTDEVSQAIWTLVRFLSARGKGE